MNNIIRRDALLGDVRQLLSCGTYQITLGLKSELKAGSLKAEVAKLTARRVSVTSFKATEQRYQTRVNRHRCKSSLTDANVLIQK